jgi:hypothetical protein
MTLAQLIREIEGAAMQHPAINMIVRNDIFRINHAPTLKYGAFAWTQGQHTGNINGMMTYNFTLFYIDRFVVHKFPLAGQDLQGYIGKFNVFHFFQVACRVHNDLIIHDIHSFLCFIHYYYNSV